MENHEAQSTIGERQPGWSDNQAHGVAFNAQRGCIAARKNLSSLCRFA